MRILLVHPHDVWSALEPWTIRILQFAASLQRMGHEVRVAYFPRTDDPGPRPESWKTVPLVALERRHSPWVFLKNILRLYRLAASADILHVQKAFHWAVVPVVIAGCLRRKPVHYDWDDWEEQIYLESARPPSLFIAWWLRTLERWTAQLAGTVSVASERLRQEAFSLGVPESRLYWAPVGADPKDFHPNLDPSGPRRRWNLNGNTVLYLGQLHGGQYIDLLLRAATLVEREISEVRVLIVGDGYQRAELEQKGRDLGLKGVVFSGSISREEVPSYIAAADVCVAAFEETRVTRCKSPLKIAEYLACGKPIVASRVGDVPRMIGEAGLLVEPGSAEHLAAGIVRLLKDADERERLGRLAREQSLGYLTWRHSAERLLRAYQTLMGTVPEGGCPQSH